MDDATPRSHLESEQLRWEVDKLDLKRQIVGELVGLLQHDRASNGAMSKIVESMATLAERDPEPFWKSRSAPVANAARLHLPSLGSLLPWNLVSGAAGGVPIDIPSPIPDPGDVLGQILSHLEAEKKMITDLIGKLLG